MASSLFCICNENPDFCGSHEKNLFCPKCSTSSFHCSDLLNHIEVFCPEPPASDVMKAGEEEEEEFTALEQTCYRRLMKFSNLEKIVRILAIHDYIRKSINSASLAHITANMLCKPKFLETVKQFKPTESEMYQAFLKLVKNSLPLTSHI